MQPNHGQRPEAYLKDLNSPPGERITPAMGEVPNYSSHTVLSAPKS